ncbi:hypothetical protein HDU81_011127 [Chytriomyces hyalinus]|nr:hypothetical protein HDU81_011127 [Chytriomyces hyalinus]
MRYVDCMTAKKMSSSTVKMLGWWVLWYMNVLRENKADMHTVLKQSRNNVKLTMVMRDSCNFGGDSLEEITRTKTKMVSARAKAAVTADRTMDAKSSLVMSFRIL